ncbi:MAG TPA: hypothetical protein VFR20_11870, partial [Burkholderiaceae bacterium]|nr:hypothetical protein [Burkholderiaceae bacterium]
MGLILLAIPAALDNRRTGQTGIQRLLLNIEALDDQTFVCCKALPACAGMTNTKPVVQTRPDAASHAYQPATVTIIKTRAACQPAHNQWPASLPHQVPAGVSPKQPRTHRTTALAAGSPAIKPALAIPSYPCQLTLHEKGIAMDKVYPSATKALDGLLFDDMTIAAGGFGL